MGLLDGLFGRKNQTEIPVIKLTGHTKAVTSCCFSPDSRYIISSSYDRTLKIWNIEQGGILLKTLTGHTDTINYCSFSPDGKKIASASHDKSIILWDLASGIIEKKFIGHTAGVNLCCFSPDGKKIASTSFDRTVKIWDLNGKILRNIEQHQSPWGDSCCFSPDGKKLVTSDATFGYIWETETFYQKKTFRPESEQAYCCSSHDGNLIGVASTRDNHLSIWDANSAKEIVTLKHKTGHNFGWSRSCCDFSPNDKYIITPDEEAIEMWDINARTKILTYHGHKYPISCCCFSPDGRFIATASSDKSIIVWLLDEVIKDVIKKHP